MARQNPVKDSCVVVLILGASLFAGLIGLVCEAVGRLS